MQFDLRRDISFLQNELRVFNIVLVPVLLMILATILAVWRSSRRRRARA